MKTLTYLPVTLSLVLACIADPPSSEIPDPEGLLVYQIEPTYCAGSPCERLELYQDGVDLHLLVFEVDDDHHLTHEALARLQPETAMNVEALAAALRSGTTELGALDPACASVTDAPLTTLWLRGTVSSFTYPSGCAPTGLVMIDQIYDEVTLALSNCAESELVVLENCDR
ncbi:MAG: hypothetical protein HC927_07455 [Deltaproteobacteria bacterium]|nr:hypothetical protein [Deltaproteobacteria bacterium]